METIVERDERWMDEMKAAPRHTLVSQLTALTVGNFNNALELVCHYVDSNTSITESCMGQFHRHFYDQFHALSSKLDMLHSQDVANNTKLEAMVKQEQEIKVCMTKHEKNYEYLQQRESSMESKVDAIIENISRLHDVNRVHHSNQDEHERLQRERVVLEKALDDAHESYEQLDGRHKDMEASLKQQVEKMQSKHDESRRNTIRCRSSTTSSRMRCTPRTTRTKSSRAAAKR